MNKKILEKAKKIKLIGMDIDGVLTGGEIVVLNSGEEVKFWNAKDRFGFALARKSGGGLKFVWITGRESKEVENQAKEIGVDRIYQNCYDKLSAYREIVKNFSLHPAEIAYIGDDLMDLPILKRVGLSVCPNDAPEELKKIVDHISFYPGGKGVFRETIEIILKAKGLWRKTINEYLR